MSDIAPPPQLYSYESNARDASKRSLPSVDTEIPKKPRMEDVNDCKDGEISEKPKLNDSDEDDGEIIFHTSKPRPPFDFGKYTRENLRTEGSRSYSRNDSEKLEKMPRAICQVLDPCPVCKKEVYTCDHYEYDELWRTYIFKRCCVCDKAGHWASDCPGLI